MSKKAVDKMDVNIGRIYFENKDEYNKFLAYKNSAEIDRQIQERLIGTETFDGIKIQKAITEFVFDVEFALYSGMSSVKIEELVEILKTEPERFKKCSCYKKDKVCEI